jgi:hypothetical protein
MNPMNKEAIPILSPELIWRELDDGTVVVTPEEGKVRVLNRTGTSIWLQINGQHSLAEIAEHLIEEFDVSQEQAVSDVTSFLTDLSQRGLIDLTD